jgi:hypothetical protein
MANNATAALQTAANLFADTLTRLTGALAQAATPLIATAGALNTSLAGLSGSLSAAAAPVQKATASIGDSLATAGSSLKSAAGPLLAVANSVGAGLGSMAGRITDLVIPGLGRRASAVGPHVGVADVLATGAFGPGLPQSTPAGPAGGVGLAPVSHLAPTHAARDVLPPSPTCWYYAQNRNR